MSDFVFYLLVLLGALQPLIWGFWIFRILVAGTQSLRGLTVPKPTYSIQANNVQINGDR